MTLDTCLGRAPATSPAITRLFCFPNAGGGAHMYAAWRRRLADSIEVCPIELPGHGRRLAVPLCRDFETLAAELVHELSPYCVPPYALFGHSLGSLVAYEVARGVQARAIAPPVALFAAARRAPHIPRRAETIHELPDNEFAEALRRMEGTSEAVLRDPEAFSLLAPVIRADFELDSTYVFRGGPPLQCPIVAIGGDDDDSVSRDDLAEWGRHTAGPFTLTMVPGNHFFVRNHDGPFLQHVAQRLVHGALTAREVHG